MSRQIEERVVEMRFDNKDFEKNVNETLKSLDGLDKSINSIDGGKLNSTLDFLEKRFSTFGVVGMTAVQNITNTFMSSAKKILSSGWDSIVSGGLNRAKNIEQAKFQLQGLGVEWKDIQEDIDYGVKDTAYALDSAAKAASVLYASGVKTGDQMKLTLRGISGVAAMTNSSYEDISSIYQSIAGSNRIMTMQLRQLESRGLNVAAVMAKEMGKTEEQIRDMVHNGKIDFQTFAKIMDDTFGPHAKEANKTLSGTIDNIKSALARVGAEFVQPLIQNEGSLVKFLNVVRTKINDFKNEIIPVAEVITKKINGVFDWLADKLEKFDVKTPVNKILSIANNAVTSITGNGYDILKTKIESLGIPIKDFESKIIEMGKKNGSITDEMIKDYEKDSKAFSSFIKEGKVSSYTIIHVLNELAKSSNISNESVKDLRDTVVSVIRGDFGNGAKRISALTAANKDYVKIQEIVNTVFKNQKIDYEKLNEVTLKNAGLNEEQIKLLKELAEEAQKSGTSINDLINNMDRPSILEQFVIIFNNLKNGAKGLYEIFKEMGSGIDGFFSSGLLNGLLENLRLLTEHMVLVDEQTGELNERGKNVKDFLEGAIGLLNIVVQILKIPMRVALSVLGELLGDANFGISDLLGFVGRAAKSFADWAKSCELVNTIFKVISTPIIFVTKIIKGLYNAIREWLIEIYKIPEVKKFIEDAKKTISDFGSSIVKWFDSASDSADSLFASIGSLAKDFAGFITEVIKGKKSLADLPEWFRTHLNLQDATNKAGESLSNFWKELVKRLGGVGQFISSVFNTIGGALAWVWDLLFRDFDPEKLFKVGILGAITYFVGAIAYKQVQLGRIFGEFAKTIKGYREKQFGNVASKFKTIATAFATIIGSIVALALVNESDLKRATSVVIAIGIMFVAIYAVMSYLNKKVAPEGTNMKPGSVLSEIYALSGIVIAINNLAKVDPERGWNAVGMVIATFAALTACMVVISKYAKYQNKQNKNTQMVIKGANQLITLFGIVSLVLLELSKIDPENGWNAVAQITAVFGALTSSLVVISKAVNGRQSKEKITIIKTLALIVAIIAVVIGILANLSPEHAGLVAFGISAIMLSLAATVYVLGKIKASEAAKAIGIAFAMAGVMTAVGIVLVILTHFVDKPEALIPLAISIALLVTTMALVLPILALVGAAIVPALIGIAALVVFVVALGALFIGIGALFANVPELEEYLDKGIPLVIKIVEGIGTIIGTFIKALATEVLDLIPLIGEKFSEFWEKFKPFIDGVMSINDAVLHSVVLLMEIIIAMTVAEIVQSIGKFFGAGGQTLIEFGALLTAFAPYLVEFGRIISSGLTQEDVDKMYLATKATKTMADVANALPNKGGWLQAITGENSLSAFAQEMLDMAPALYAYILKVREMQLTENDITLVDISAKCIERLVEVSSNLPGHGGWLQAITGDNDLSKFAKEMSDVLPAMESYVLKVREMQLTEKDVDLVDISAQCIERLVEVSSNLPGHGGLVQMITGDNDLSKFAIEMRDTAKELPGYLEMARKLKITDIMYTDISASVIERMIQVEEKLPKKGGWLQAITGENSLADFGKEMTDLAPHLIKYVNKIRVLKKKDIDTATNASAIAETMARMAYIVSNSETESWLGKSMVSLTDFGKDMVGFSEQMIKFINNISSSEINLSFGFRDRLDSILNIFKLIYYTMTDVISETYKVLPKQDKSLASLLFGDTTTLFSSYAIGIGSVISTLIDSLTKIDKYKGKIDSTTTTKVTKLMDIFVQADSKIATLTSLGSAVSEEYSTGLYKLIEASVDSVKKINEDYPEDDSRVDSVIEMLSKLNTFASQINPEVASRFNDFTLGVKNLSNISMDNFIDGFGTEDASNKAIKAMEKFGRTIRQAYDKKKMDITSPYKDAVTAAIDAFKSSLNDESTKKAIKDQMGTFIEIAISAVNDQIGSKKEYKGFYAAGADAAQGFINGFNSKNPAIKQAALDLASTTKKQTASGLQIKSPSKVMYKIGAYAAEGFVNGISSYKKLVYKISDDLADGATNGFSDAISIIRDSFDGQISDQPVIRPVLDLSDVRNGARYINGMFNNGNVIALSTNGSIGNQNRYAAPMINITINGAPGQDVNELADIVSAKLNTAIQRRNSVWR